MAGLAVSVVLNQPPCAVRSRTPYLFGIAYGQPPFSGLATQQRLAPGSWLSGYFHPWVLFAAIPRSQIQITKR